MVSSRRIAALRALAERPGTEAEGQVARRMLERAYEVQTERAAPDVEFEKCFHAFRRHRAEHHDFDLSEDGFRAFMRRFGIDYPTK